MLRGSIVFLMVYIGLVLSNKNRWLIAWGGVAAALIIRALYPAEIFHGIHWNVIGIFAGSLLLAETFIYSKMPETISDQLINKSPNLGAAFMAIIVFASFFSIFLDNVITVLIIAPIALQLTRKAGVSPVPVIIGLAISSNLQGMAILIGDTPSMLLAAKMRLGFLEFFWYQGRPSIFWIVQIGALAGFFVLYWFFRGDRQKLQQLEVTPVRSWVPMWLILLAIVLLSFMTKIDPGFSWFGGTACMGAGVGGFIWQSIRARKEKEKISCKFDFETVAFLMAIFVLVHMLVQRGVVELLINNLEGLKGKNIFVIYSVIVWFSVIVSSFIDNIPYIAAMLPLVTGLSTSLGVNPALLAFGLLIGSCMGGNITPIGATANLVAIGILRREGREVSFGDFVRVGLPFTVAATATAWIVLWWIYGPAV
ncbi:MAG: TRAP transporter large permease subunit [Candidatus Krumholzibacteriota bacterium]|nr:TRAP transporter large permease subunit [Candidatus Krumholzibacteriota bacterium]